MKNPPHPSKALLALAKARKQDRKAGLHSPDAEAVIGQPLNPNISSPKKFKIWLRRKPTFVELLILGLPLILFMIGPCYNNYFENRDGVVVNTVKPGFLIEYGSQVLGEERAEVIGLLLWVNVRNTTTERKFVNLETVLDLDLTSYKKSSSVQNMRTIKDPSTRTVSARIAVEAKSSLSEPFLMHLDIPIDAKDPIQFKKEIEALPKFIRPRVEYEWIGASDDKPRENLISLGKIPFKSVVKEKFIKRYRAFYTPQVSELLKVLSE